MTKLRLILGGIFWAIGRLLWPVVQIILFFLIIPVLGLIVAWHFIDDCADEFFRDWKRNHG